VEHFLLLVLLEQLLQVDLTRFAQHHIHTYIHVLSLCHLYTLLWLLKEYK
jgi:hypothetical protein